MDDGNDKGDSGKILVIGGSSEYTGAPFFSAISALKAGADLVYIITIETAAPIIKSYSPDIIVYPYLHTIYLPKIKHLIAKMDVIVIGPGLGRDDDTLALLYEIIHICKKKLKPLVIDADGLYAISRNISVIEQYPSPGVILTPNHREAEKLELSVPVGPQTFWARYWGDYVSVLLKGKNDTFHSAISSFGWFLDRGGSARRSGGQGDILAGALGTFYHWGLKADICANTYSVQIAQSLAAAAAANMTRMCNALAFHTYGRNKVVNHDGPLLLTHDHRGSGAPDEDHQHPSCSQ
ncbi:carbohydrate kinase domain-containing protein [Phthorimaea operculella]|nr:carbohydrate kinase domain-containing protein [Phthorimaea operculella]